MDYNVSCVKLYSMNSEGYDVIDEFDVGGMNPLADRVLNELSKILQFYRNPVIICGCGVIFIVLVLSILSSLLQQTMFEIFIHVL